MAPRKESELHRDDRNNDGTRNRQYLNAHTGAGVNANRPAALRDQGGGSRRGSRRTRGISRPASRGNHRGFQRRAPTSTPGRRFLEHLSFHEDRQHRSQVQGASDNDAMLQAQQDHHEQHTSTNVSTHQMQHSLVARNPLTSTIITANTRTTQQQQHQQQKPALPSTLNNTFLSTRSRTFPSSPNLTYHITPPSVFPAPNAPVVKQHGYTDDTEVAKRAFTNPKLRTIMSGKRYPTQRKKAAAEKPVLKMGLKREYK